MPSAVRLREDYSAEDLRGLARRSRDVNQSRRLLSLAGVRDEGRLRRSGAWTARRFATGFTASTPRVQTGFSTTRPKVRSPACHPSRWPSSPGSSKAGPDREKDGVVRWRRVDLKRVIAETFGVDFHERYVGTLLKKLGFSPISARPRHPAQDERIVEAFKKTSRAR